MVVVSTQINPFTLSQITIAYNKFKKENIIPINFDLYLYIDKFIFSKKALFNSNNNYIQFI